MDLHARLELVGDRIVLALDGVVDLATIPILHAHLQRAISEHPGGTVHVDLDTVTALDDCGLGVLLGAAGRARDQGGDVVVIASADRLRERFRSTGLDRAVSVRERL